MNEREPEQTEAGKRPNDGDGARPEERVEDTNEAADDKATIVEPEDGSQED